MNKAIKLENINITINNLTKAYSKDKGVFDLNLSLNSGGINLLIGKNGSGKSTLLKCIMKLINYSGNIEKKRWRIGYAPEYYIMPDFFTVEEFLYNIGRIKGLGKVAYHDQSIDLLRMFNLESYRHKQIRSLSNGMKQKVNLLQALIHDPKIIILDEPLIALDSESQKNLLSYLHDKAKTRLVIISTHSPEKFKYKSRNIIEIVSGRIQ